MAARTTGAAQRVVNGPTTTFGANLNANIAGVNPITSLTALNATDVAYEVSAGSSISITWGGNVSALFGAGVAADTATWTMNAFYDTGQNLWETAATDTLTQVGVAIGSCNRTLTFTPTHNGTIRLFVNYKLVATAVPGTTLAQINTDGGNFGSPAEVLPATSADVGFTPGLIRAGTTLTSFAQSGGNGSGVYATYGKTIVNTRVTGHASRFAEAAFTGSVAWKQSTTTFATTTVPTSTSTSVAGPGLNVSNAATTGWPNKTAFSPTLVLSPNNSALSTANGGSGLPWNHYTSVPSGPGTVTTTTDAAGNIITVTFTGAFTADNSLIHQKYMQLNTAALNTPPDGVTDLTHNVPDRTGGDIGEISHRVKDANGAGVNGIAYTTGSITIQDINGLTAIQTRAGNNLATTTLNGAAGWVTASTGLGGANANLLAWSGAAPGGLWNYSWTISTANAVGLDSPASPVTFALQVQNPHIQVAAYFNGVGVAAGGLRHIAPGDTFKFIATATDELTGMRQTIDSADVWMTHANANTGLFENLISATDNTTAAWVAWPAANARVKFALAQDGSDVTVWSKTFSATAGWGNYPVVVRGNIVVGGVNYSLSFGRELPGSANSHSGFSFDAVGYATKGKISFK